MHSLVGIAGHFDLSNRVYVYSCNPGWDARDTLGSAAAYTRIPAFLDGTRGTLWTQQQRTCIFLHSWVGRAGHFEVEQPRICVLLHFWVGRAGHFDLRSRVGVLIRASLGGTRGTFWIEHPRICAFLHSWVERARHFDWPRICVFLHSYSCMPGSDARDTLSSAAAYMWIPAFLRGTRGTLSGQQPRICVFLHS